MPAVEQLAWLVEQAGSDAGMRVELAGRFEVFRAHQRALSGYRPGGHVRANTVLIGADSSLNRNALPRWLELLDGPASAHYLAGDHYSFLRGSGVEEIARLIGDQDPSAWVPGRSRTVITTASLHVACAEDPGHGLNASIT